MIRSKTFTRCFGSSGVGKSQASSGSKPGDRYKQTTGNLKIGSHTRVIFQGFTGRQATANAKESIEWGTNIVGGVTPGKSGEHLGLPVLPTVKEAMEQLKPDATGIYVAAHQAASAIEEAIEAEVPLIVAVAEHIPVHDILRVHSILATQTKSRLVGANSPGIISAVGKCRIGFQPLSCFTPGRIGIVAKSGTLSYEAVASTTEAGLGQSLCIGMGGDMLAGTDFVDALEVFEHEKDTEAIIVIGEIGGEAEIEAAAWIEEYKKRSPNPKPIAALVAGLNAPHYKVMGHAGALLLPGKPSAQDKIRAFDKVGVGMVNHPAKFGKTMIALLETTRNSIASISERGASQTRGIHTVRVRPTSKASPMDIIQKRSIYLNREGTIKLLDEKKIPRSKIVFPLTTSDFLRVAFYIDQADGSPCIVLKGLDDGRKVKIPLLNNSNLDSIIIEHDPEITRQYNPESLFKIIQGLSEIFREREATFLGVCLGNRHIMKDGKPGAPFSTEIGSADFYFKNTNIEDEINPTGNDSSPRADHQTSAEAEAEKHGMLYHKLHGSGSIGTLVNGAGLAMNTIDALEEAGGSAANFLDTGGKATAETIKRAFGVILADERVKVIFVNVFGGLTRGDMIAEGILLAFKEVGVSVPVVVRIRGTNEKEGQKIIAESGLPLYAYHDFDEAAAKAIELAGGSKLEQVSGDNRGNETVSLKDE